MKQIKLIIASLLLLVGGNVFAQTGTAPYVGSTHTYEVTRGVAGSTLVWSVLNADKNSASTDDFSIATNGLETVDIKWKTANVAATNSNYIVQLSEEALAADGGCTTLRQFIVTVGANEFDISTGNVTASCSGASGDVINDTNSNLDNTTKVFKIDMSTQADMPTATFKPSWEFNYTITSVGVDLASVAFDANTTVSGASISIDKKTATGKVVVAADDYSIDATVIFTSVLGSMETVTLVLTDGKELTHQTPEKDALVPTNNTGSVTINAMPATTNIETDL